MHRSAATTTTRANNWRMDHHEPRSWQEMLCLGTIAIENRLNQEKLEEIGGIALEENWVKERF